MAENPSSQDERSQILQDTLRQISSTAAGADSQCCVICLGELAEPCEARPCRHSHFDYLCLVTWLETSATCPLCKAGVSEVGYELGEDGEHGKVHKVQAAEEDVRGASRFRRRGGLASGHPGRPRPYDDEAVRRRRLIYRQKLYSLHVGANSRQAEKPRYWDLSPLLFATDQELVSRTRMWLRRELRVFRFLYGEDANDLPLDRDPVRRCRPCNAEYLLEYIVAILKSMDMQGSAGQAEEMIREFLGRDNTRLFLHELRAWLRSPCTSLSEWDRLVQYRDEGVLGRVSEGTRDDLASREQPGPV
jgi:hypothetical protein